MRTRAAKLVTALALLLGAALAVPSTASAATISSGHLDVLDVDYVGGALTLNIRDETVSPVNDDLSPATTTLKAVPASLSSVPSGSAYACLGTAGSPVYLLPQSQNPSLLWPGWSTEGIPSGALSGDKIGLQLVASVVPSGATFALYTTSVGSASFKFNTSTASGCGISTWPGGLSRNVHGHGWWAFSKPGTYQLTFRATATTSGGAALSSGNVTYVYDVG